MNKRNLWIYIFGITIIIIGLIKLDTLISMVSILWNACRVLVFGAMMAFVINLVMAKIEKRLDFMKKGKRATSLLLSLFYFSFCVFLNYTRCSTVSRSHWSVVLYCQNI